MGNPMSEQIAKIIEQMLEDNSGVIELQRNKLANSVGCVPSQINYVITSRFNPDRGYIVESRRGGGGFVKITKVSFNSKSAILMHMLSAIGDSIDTMSARALLVSLYDNGMVTERELKLMLCATSDRVLSQVGESSKRDSIRSDLMKSFILSLKD